MKLIAKDRSIRGYRRISKDELINSINESKPIRKSKAIKGIKKFNIDDRMLRDMRTLYELD